MENKLKSKSAITLIALVITIIIILILAAVVLNITTEKGIIGRANEASFKQKMAAIAEELETYNAGLFLDGQSTSYYAGDILLDIIYTEELEIDTHDVLNISSILKKIGKKEKEYVMVYEGNLYYVSQDSIKNNANQTKWCRELGIRIYEYEGTPTGIKVINGNYELVKGVYMCTPKLDMGWSKDNTRYLNYDNGNLVAGKWINKKPDDNWYDYKNQVWANIYVEANGIESYYVWIPRYVYKEVPEITDLNQKRTDIKFVDKNNNYTDGDTGITTNWSALQSQGYKLPEAFTFGGQDLPGYWMSKYQLGELATYTVEYGTTANANSITIKDVAISSSETVARYTYAINGTIVYDKATKENYTIKNIAKGNKIVNVTALNANGEIIGSMTKVFNATKVNEPDTSKFDQDTTFYVWWDENEIEHNDIPVREKAPDEWYDYGTQNWANIVTRNNGMETYYVWIPRYQYMVDTTTTDMNKKRTYVKFIEGTGTTPDSGYKIPEAFTFDGKQLTGYWITKYQLGDEGTAPAVNAEISAGSNLIRIKDITGTSISTAKTNGTELVYLYYLNGKKIHDGTNEKENYVYEGLTADTEYTINIIVREKVSDKYIGAITKKIKTIAPNVPDVSKFDAETTYYVYYEGNTEKRLKVKGNNPPANWYDYSNQVWANIVTTANNTETYFTWIPRYEYRILSDRTRWGTANSRTDINFIPTSIKNNNCTPGYKVPEAFTFGGIELSGYWITKYQLGE